MFFAGRALNVHCGASGCQYENNDGLLYAFLSDDAIHVLQRHTVAAQLSALAMRPTTTASPAAVQVAAGAVAGRGGVQVPKAFVLRYEWDPSQVQILSGEKHLTLKPHFLI